MSVYDLKRLDIAIQYIRRMAAGRNPVTNRPAPENEILTNGNVNRCLLFVEEILADVKSTGGIVGSVPRASKAPKPSVAQTFPYEILREFQYVEDRQISFFLGQIAGLLPEGTQMPVRATMITNWLRENGYLVKRMMEDTGKENSVPTEAGTALGIYAEKAGLFPNEYYRVFYNAQAQQFLVDNFKKILTESEALAKKKRAERKQQDAGDQKGSGSPQSTGNVQGTKSPRDVEKSFPVYADRAGRGRRSRGALLPKGDPASVPLPADAPAPQRREAPSPPTDDPAFASLLANAPFSQEDSYAGADFGAASDLMGEGWESVDEGLPW